MRVSSALRSAEAPPLAKWITSLTIVLYSASQILFNYSTARVTIVLFLCRELLLCRIILLPRWLSYYFTAPVTIVLFYCPADYRIILLPPWLSYYFTAPLTIVLFYCPGDYRIILLPPWLSYYFTAPLTIVLFYCPGDYRIILCPGDYPITPVLLGLRSTRDSKNSSAHGNSRVHQGIM